MNKWKGKRAGLGKAGLGCLRVPEEPFCGTGFLGGSQRFNGAQQKAGVMSPSV